MTIGTVTLDPLTLAVDPITVISGGSLEVPVTSSVPFSTIYVNSDDVGYFQILLPEAVSSTTAVINYNTELVEDPANQVAVVVETPTGDVSAAQVVALETVSVGTGDVQVSVSWDTETDVDLWLVEPDGTTIDFSDDVSDSGGALDLDSNPICFIDGVNNENITYEGVTPPSGEYTVVVDYYSACGLVQPTSFVVTVRANGTVRTFSGELSSDNNNVIVTTFIIP